MNVQSIFALQFLMSLAAWSAIAWLLAGPWLARLPRHEAIAWLLLPHVFRHLGLVFLVPGVVDQPLPESFSVPAAYGDLAAGLLALVSLVALKRRWPMALGLAWTFNVVGTVDLLNALSHGEVAPLFGSTWYIPTMLVPLLLVTHCLVFRELMVSRAPRPAQAEGGPAH